MLPSFLKPSSLYLVPPQFQIPSSQCICRVVTCLRQWKNKLVEAGFQELVFEDAMEVVIDQLNSLGTEEPLKIAMLAENMRCVIQIMHALMLQAHSLTHILSFFYWRPFGDRHSMTIATALLFCRSQPSMLLVLSS